jgi:hypothetical protein
MLSVDTATVRRGLRAVGDELAFGRSELGRWAADRGASPGAVRAAIVEHIRGRARPGTPPRTARRFGLIAACDLDGESHKRIAADFGLSRAQFYRERRLAIEEIRAIVVDAVGSCGQSVISEPFRSIVFATGDRERAFRELQEVALMLNRASGNGVAARLAREARAAAAIFEGRDGSIAV